jgi:hypothetical protein
LTGAASALSTATDDIRHAANIAAAVMPMDILLRRPDVLASAFIVDFRAAVASTWGRS